MKMNRISIGLAIAITLLCVPALQAQSTPPWELNVHIGGFFPDVDEDTDAEFMLGARIFVHLPNGLGFGGNFDWVPRDQFDLPEGFEDEDININSYLYSAEVNYTFPSRNAARFFVGAGLGAVTTKWTDVPSGDIDETDLLMPLSVGFMWLNNPESPKWAIRIEGRDNIIFAEMGNGDTEAENNWELSGGVSFFLGS
jgi:opacity protein-like surface antigen